MTTPQRILFATMPMDGHFSPLTGLAVHLSQLGHDVRWYVGGHYGERVTRLGLHHYPPRRAKTVTAENLDSLYPERAKINGTIARLRFDLKQVFLLRAPEFTDDLCAMYADWPFDLLVHDVAFLAGPIIQHVLKVKTVAVGVMPLGETDDKVPPAGLGMQPATSVVGQWRQRLLRYAVQQVLFKPSNDLYNQLREQYGLPRTTTFLFDSVVRSADLYLQSGVPGFEYPRKRISSNIRFVGPLLPHRRGRKQPFEHTAQTLQARRVVLVTQGTVERDVDKLLVPTLEAFKNDPSTVVIATTGGAQTDELRDRFPQPQFIIEDFIDFNAVMPHVDVYVTNGGYGGVMLALQHKLPVIGAGIHEGKNEINARIDYCRLGIDLKTETPKAAQIRRAVQTVLTTETYRQNVRKLGREFGQYNPNALAEQYIHALLAQQPAHFIPQN